MDAARKRFGVGLLLAWLPWIPTLIGIGHAFGGVSNTKATGLAAVAGGFGEILVFWGLASMLVCQVLAIVCLWRSFSRENTLRNLVAGISIGMSGLLLLVMSLFVWAAWYVMRKR